MNLYFTKNLPEEILKTKKRAILNFFNLHNIWLIFNNQFYQGLIQQPQNINFPDGNQISKKLKIPQQRGPSFTKRFLLSDLAKNKKHFFIGLNNEDINKLSKICNISLKNLKSHNPPFIRGIEFPINERKKIIKLINSFKPDFIWICIGSPKQDILANQLFEKYSSIYFNIGAATDFLLKKKKEAPKIFQKLGLEWFYRLIIDFNHSKKKVWRSFIAIKYLKNVKVK